MRIQVTPKEKIQAVVDELGITYDEFMGFINGGWSIWDNPIELEAYLKRNKLTREQAEWEQIENAKEFFRDELGINPLCPKELQERMRYYK